MCPSGRAATICTPRGRGGFDKNYPKYTKHIIARSSNIQFIDKKQWNVSNNHLIDLCKVNYIGITLNSTACIDIVQSGIPCLEFWYNEKDKLNMIHGETLFERQKIVKKLKNFEDLEKEFKRLQKKIYYSRLVRYQYAKFKKIYSLHKTNLMVRKLLQYELSS